MVTLYMVQTCPWMLSRQNSFGAVGTGAVEGVDPFAVPQTPMLLQGTWSDPDITALKWACFQDMAALTSSPFMIIPIALSIVLDPTMTSTFSE